jgi:outer membrane protein OmpA-like peptidoglycan-associated protein
MNSEGEVMNSNHSTPANPRIGLLLALVLVVALPIPSWANSTAAATRHEPGISVSDRSLEVAGQPSAERARGYMIRFELNSSEIRDEFAPYLDDLGRLMQIEEARWTRLTIEGHADATGSSSQNEILSGRRALAIANYLIRNWGIDPDRLMLKAYGDSDPLAGEASSSGMNRRVQFRITY